MNSIITTKLLSHTHQFAGREWHYDFRKLFDEFEEVKIKRNIASLSQRYSKITKDWGSERNSEWMCRIYLSAKMILGATLQLGALLHATQQNLRIVSQLTVEHPTNGVGGGNLGSIMSFMRFCLAWLFVFQFRGWINYFQN